MGVGLFDFGGDLVTAEAVHRAIGHDEIKFASEEFGEAVLPIGSGGHLVLINGEVDAEDVADQVVVIDDENP